MTRRGWKGTRELVLMTLSLAVFIGGCRCGKKSDEEVLRERIDTTSVHLYLASKIAVLKADQSAEAKAALTALTNALDALNGNADETATERVEGTEQEQAQISPTDLLVLAKSLYALKKEGEELLQSGDEKGMKPILPLLFNPHPALAQAMDLNLEHAMLFSAMFVFKFHPRSPLPIPPEVLLYEAYMTKPETLLPGLQSFVRAEKAVIYGTNELCDLSAAEARGVEAEQASLESVIDALRLTGAEPTFDEARFRETYAAVRALAHGVSAVCYQKRDEPELAVQELDETLRALEEAGVGEEQTALLRAYTAMQRGDQAKAKEYLALAAQWEGTDPQTKRDLEALSAKLSDDPNAFEKKLGRGWFTLYLTKIVLRRLDEAGAFDDLKNTELVRTLNGFVAATSQLGDGAKKAASSGLWDEVRGALPGIP